MSWLVRAIYGKVFDPLISNWPLVAVAIWATLVAIKTLKTLRDQTKATTEAATGTKASVDALIASERAWVIPELRPFAIRSPDGKSWGYREAGFHYLRDEEIIQGKHLQYFFKLTNMGRTPAQIFDFTIRYTVLAKGVQDFREIPEGDVVEYREFHRMLAGDGASIETEETVVDVDTNFKEGLRAIAESNKTAVVHGSVKYRHMFSTTEDCFADFCYSYSPSRQVLTPVGRYTKQRQERSS